MPLTVKQARRACIQVLKPYRSAERVTQFEEFYNANMPCFRVLVDSMTCEGDRDNDKMFLRAYWFCMGAGLIE